MFRYYATFNDGREKNIVFNHPCYLTSEHGGKVLGTCAKLSETECSIETDVDLPLFKGVSMGFHRSKNTVLVYEIALTDIPVIYDARIHGKEMLNDC
jgi:hypothetical protein